MQKIFPEVTTDEGPLAHPGAFLGCRLPAVQTAGKNQQRHVFMREIFAKPGAVGDLKRPEEILKRAASMEKILKVKCPKSEGLQAHFPRLQVAIRYLKTKNRQAVEMMAVGFLWGGAVSSFDGFRGFVE